MKGTELPTVTDYCILTMKVAKSYYIHNSFFFQKILDLRFVNSSSKRLGLIFVKN